ncbi:MAG TPA: hypothetical protein PKD84_02075 [Propionicimonas sp.]|nr:hypothetical protein [Propionicimonas sp.]
MRRYLDAEVRRLSDGWQLTRCEPGAIDSPAALAATRAVTAIVPGTAAAALAAAGRFDAADPEPLQDADFWYHGRLAEPAGPAVLRFEGLATLAEVFLNGELILTSESMFESHDVPVELTGSDELAIRFAALSQALAAKGPRAKWRPRLFDNQGLRLVRTTLLGHMPGWCPSIQAVGPYREISVIRPGRLSLDDLRIAADLTEDGVGLLAVGAGGVPVGTTVRCAGVEAAFGADGERMIATLVIADIEPWWPHTHGSPTLYDIELVLADGSVHRLARTGFRHLEVTEADDFGLQLNGVPVFCRGAVWTSADLLGLSGDRQTYAPLLKRLAAAGANMVRIPGITTYEAPAFFDLCDELGLLVFQDFMFANFDYPGDEAFLDHVREEVQQFLEARQGCPSLAVTSAGSEIAQQAAMLGLPEPFWYSALATELLPSWVAEYRPDVAYVPGSPSGGALPFSVDAGVGHYYGVGAYGRPLEDARRASVRFTSECLAFANAPQHSSLPADLTEGSTSDEAWRVGVPQDPGTDWNFADTRDHYLGLLYDRDPHMVRAEDPQQYLALSQAVSGEVATETFAEWRTGATTHGALVFTVADLAPGFGWGIIDSSHQPKPIFYALARAWRPVTVAMTDEGVNGLRIHLLNDTAEAVAGTVEVFGIRDGSVMVSQASRAVVLAGRSRTAVAATDLLGGFFDYNYAYRFGPAEHDVVLARLRSAQGILAEAFHFPLGRSAALREHRLGAQLIRDDDGWSVEVSTDGFAQSVHVQAEGFEADDGWFHLAPDEPHRVRLRPQAGFEDRRPQGFVASLNGHPARY